MMQPQRLESQPLVRPLQVGPEWLACNLVLAPMAGVTNLPFRLIAKQAGAGLVFTETVSARGLINSGARTWQLVESSPVERPLAYQLFGKDPEVLAEATRRLVDRGARFIDLNLGCPVKKFIRNGAGSALLREPARVASIVAAMRAALPDGALSVKLRLGWDADSITAPEVARVSEAEGVDFVSVHGRTRSQQYRGVADRARIREVVEAVSIPVFANGDVVRAEQVIEMLVETGAAGVMIGRGAMRNPWIFAQAAELSAGRRAPQPSSRERAELVERHLGIMVDYYDDERFCVHMVKKYLCAYSTGIPGGGSFRERVNRATQLERVLRDAEQFFREAA
jgi:nifR3 family TIM-barrel protein